MEKFNDLKKLVSNLEEDASKFYDKNNKTTGVRIRKGMQEIKALAQNIRNEISEIKNQ